MRNLPTGAASAAIAASRKGSAPSGRVPLPNLGVIRGSTGTGHQTSTVTNNRFTPIPGIEYEFTC